MNDNFMTGWVCLYRSVRDHWLWEDPAKLQRWIDILLEVNHHNRKVNLGNNLVSCERGQSVRSIGQWAKRWNVSKDTARNFLNLLVQDEMITLESIQISTRLTVCNYDSYQNATHERRTTAVRPLDTNNNENKGNNETKEDNIFMSKGHLSITWDEFNKLSQDFGAEKSEDIIERVLNWSKNSKYKSLYLTARQWLKRDKTSNEPRVETPEEAIARKRKYLERD